MELSARLLPGSGLRNRMQIWLSLIAQGRPRKQLDCILSVNGNRFICLKQAKEADLAEADTISLILERLPTDLDTGKYYHTSIQPRYFCDQGTTDPQPFRTESLGVKASGPAEAFYLFSKELYGSLWQLAPHSLREISRSQALELWAANFAKLQVVKLPAQAGSLK